MYRIQHFYAESFLQFINDLMSKHKFTYMTQINLGQYSERFKEPNGSHALSIDSSTANALYNLLDCAINNVDERSRRCV
ncbi:hypothetical protein BDQ12DRAFT_680143 [Crucibulum laeve]|uniref:Uncharacterized protein n=1 Tax=Crucibulum laeve TaxID=68775 RepID=A0A5C3M608_9AGAR|nr:hypothetical protein BDQ12DRAFT_680143 [Crucibulum laeve]